MSLTRIISVLGVIIVFQLVGAKSETSEQFLDQMPASDLHYYRPEMDLMKETRNLAFSRMTEVLEATSMDSAITFLGNLGKSLTSQEALKDLITGTLLWFIAILAEQVYAWYTL